MKQIKLNMDLYLNAFKTSVTKHKFIKGGTIHDFLKESRIEYYSGKCPVYYIEHIHNVTGERCVIGGNYATNRKPELSINEKLDFN
jgi:hypothetical protein